MRFVWGVVGGIAPEIYRLWTLRENGWVRPRSFWPISGCMAILSGLFAWAAASDEPMAAIYVGVSTPYIISAMVAQVAGRGAVPLTQTAPGLPHIEQPGSRVETYPAGGPIEIGLRQRLTLFMRSLSR